jgi:hypothetical protein
VRQTSNAFVFVSSTCVPSLLSHLRLSFLTSIPFLQNSPSVFRKRSAERNPIPSPRRRVFFFLSFFSRFCCFPIPMAQSNTELLSFCLRACQSQLEKPSAKSHRIRESRRRQRATKTRKRARERGCRAEGGACRSRRGGEEPSRSAASDTRRRKKLSFARKTTHLAACRALRRVLCG